MKQQRKPRNRLVLQVIALGYVAYLLVGMVRDFQAGTAPVSLPVFCLVTGLLAAAEIALAVLIYREWRRDRAAGQEEQEENPDQQA